jgi:hypothetical protein
MQDVLRDLHAVYRELTGASARYSTIARLTEAGNPDLDATIATPSHGMATVHITPPSGALARVPEPARATPPSAGGSRPPAGLELVNFQDPSAQPAAAPTSRRMAPTGDASRRATRAIVAVVALALAAVAGWLVSRGRSTAPAPAPAAAPAPTAATPSDLPTPELGVDARPQAAPGAAPPPAAAARAPTSPPKPAAPRRHAVQFSSIPPSTLSVDGRVIGPSVPAQRVELEEGAHRYRFEVSGLPPYEQGFRVGPNGAPPVAYQFPVGTLIVQSDPTWIGASVIVDGKYKATVQSGVERLRLAPGSHHVILLREGFQPANREVTIDKGSEVSWAPAPAAPLQTGG